MDFIINFDTQLFYFLNITLANPITDILMPILTNQQNWLPIYIFMIFFLLIKYKKNGFFIVITIIIAVSLGDYINSSIIKDLVGRVRPCANLNNIHLLVPCGPGKSFMSSHAVNNFAIAYVLGYYFRQNKWIFFTLASMVAYSRIAVGVHYPLDVVCGATFGVFIGIVSVKLSNWTLKSLSKKRNIYNSKN